MLKIGNKTVEVWHTPGHTHGQLSFRMDETCFSAAIISTATVASAISICRTTVRDIPAFIRSLERIRDSDVEWLLPRVTVLSSARTTRCWNRPSSD